MTDSRSDKSYSAVSLDSGSQGDSAIPINQALSDVIADVLNRRSDGENVSDDDVIAAHPELLPDLKRELAIVQTIHLTVTSALTRLQNATDGFTSADSGSNPLQHDDVHLLPEIPGFRILEEISSGGQAVVFKAIQESTGKTIAIKVLHGGPFAGSRGRARFDLESNILAQIDHPNIVGIIDRGRTADGSFYRVMDYIAGQDMETYLKQSNLDLHATLLLFARITRALEEPHSKGIIHRDLKPTNVMVDQRGEPHILDFGLACLLENDGDCDRARLTLTGQVVGSLFWASPEQVSGDSKSVDARSDVYSVGVMLYQAITGQFPYEVTGGIAAVSRNIQKSPPLPLVSRSKLQLSDSVSTVVLKALAKSPLERYQSAAELVTDIETLLQGRTVSTPERRRHPKLLLPLLLVVVAITAIAISMLAKSRWNLDEKPQVYELPSFANTVGMKMVRIPSGSFMMGSPTYEPGRSYDEDGHLARIPKSFYISTMDVTQSEYKAIMGNLPVGEKFESDSTPVRNVNWYDAMGFCRQLSKKENRVYRLPLESEWEYACRAGTVGPYPGNEVLDDMDWYRDNSDAKIHPVGLKYANNWGLYDMNGNVRQWCLDVAKLPSDASDRRVVRGGDFTSSAEKCRSASRFLEFPDIYMPTIGFRIVCETHD